MKLSLLAACCLVAMVQSSVAAESRPSLGTIVLRSGRVYEECRLFQADLDGVMVLHKNGGAKLLYAEMPEETRNRLGYDGEALKDREKRISDARQARSELRRELIKEIVKAHLEIHVSRMGANQLYPAADWGYAAYPSYFAGFDGGSGWFGSPWLGERRHRGHHHHAPWRSVKSGPVPDLGGHSIRMTGHRHGRPGVYRPTPLGIPALGAPAPALAPRTGGKGR